MQIYNKWNEKGMSVKILVNFSWCQVTSLMEGWKLVKEHVKIVCNVTFNPNWLFSRKASISLEISSVMFMLLMVWSVNSLHVDFLSLKITNDD